MTFFGDFCWIYLCRGATFTALLGALPKELVFATAGIALFGIIGNSLATAMLTQEDREAALITFLITASGITLLGIGSSFWGLVIGSFVFCLCRFRDKPTNGRSKAGSPST